MVLSSPTSLLHATGYFRKTGMYKRGLLLLYLIQALTAASAGFTFFNISKVEKFFLQTKILFKFLTPRVICL